MVADFSKILARKSDLVFVTSQTEVKIDSLKNVLTVIHNIELEEKRHTLQRDFDGQR